MDQPHDNHQPQTTLVTITIKFEHQQPEPQNNITGGYTVADWCDNMEKLPSKAQEIILEYLTPKQ